MGKVKELAMEKELVYNVTLDGSGPALTLKREQLEAVLYEFQNMQEGDVFQIEAVEMTRMDLENMGEFQGW